MANVMHSYVFLAAFLISLFLKLPTATFVDARKLGISNGSFSIDLIHRHHSPLSPYYNSSKTLRESLKGASLRSISHGLRGHHHDNSLDITPDYGEYLIKFALGTPPVEQFAIADTGSSLIWVQCSPCKFCFPQNFPFFDPSKSSTFRTLHCASKACNNYHDFNTISCPLDQTINTHLIPCLYHVPYADGTQTIGVLAMETISFPSTNLHLSIFGCGFDQNGSLSLFGNGAGIVGLGTGPSSLISQLGPRVNYKFSYCLTHLFTGVTSKLHFGADVTGPGVVSTPFLTGNASQMNHLYYLKLDGISIKAKKHHALVPADLFGIIDSGTTLTHLPQSLYDDFKAALVRAINHTPVSDPDYELCYKTRKFNPPDVVFHFKEADVVLKGYNTFLEVDDKLTCLMIVGSTESAFIFGNIAHVNFHVGYDLQAKQVSFAPADCTKY